MERQQNLPTPNRTLEMMQGPVDAFRDIPEGGIDGARVLRAGMIGAVTVPSAALFVYAGPQFASSIDRAVTPRAEAAVGGSQLLNVECVDNPAGAGLPRYVRATYAFTELSGIENGDARYAIVWNPDEMVPGLGQPDVRSSGDIRNLLSPLRSSQTGETSPAWIEGQKFSGYTTFEEPAPVGVFTVRATFEGKDDRNIFFSKEYQATLRCNSESPGPGLPPPAQEPGTPVVPVPPNPPVSPPQNNPQPVCENGKVGVTFRPLAKKMSKNKPINFQLSVINNSRRKISAAGNGASRNPRERAQAVGIQVDLPDNVRLPKGIVRIKGKEFIDLNYDLAPRAKFIRNFPLTYAKAGNFSGFVSVNLPSIATGFCKDTQVRSRATILVRK